MGMLNRRRTRDAAISTAQRKWDCQDKDKLRRREKEIRGRLDISKNDGGGKRSKWNDESKGDGWRGRQRERDRG